MRERRRQSKICSDDIKLKFAAAVPIKILGNSDAKPKYSQRLYQTETFLATPSMKHLQ